MATSFMENGDYLDDRRYVRANRYPARRARGASLRACDREQRRPPCIKANFVEAAVIIDASRDPVASRRFDDLIKEAQIIIEP